MGGSSWCVRGLKCYDCATLIWLCPCGSKWIYHSARTQKSDPEANIKHSTQLRGLGRPRWMTCSSSYMPDYSLTSGVPPQPSVSRSTFITCQRCRIQNILDDCSAADPLHAAASNLTCRLFCQSGKSSQHESLPTANNWHTESIRTTVWQICFSVNATCQWWIVNATKLFFKWIQQLGFGPQVNSFDKCTPLCLSSFCSIIFMLKWSNLSLGAQSVGVDYPSRWCPPR